MKHFGPELTLPPEQIFGFVTHMPNNTSLLSQIRIPLRKGKVALVASPLTHP